MKTVICTTLEQKFMQDWKNLWETSSFANYVNSPQWFLSVIESFQYKNFIIIALYKDEKLSAVAALVKEKKYGIDFYTVAPGDFVCGIPFLVDIQNKKSISILCESLSKAGNIILNNIPKQFVATLKENMSGINFTDDNLNLYMDIKKDEKERVVIINKNKLLYKSRNIQEKFTLKPFDGEDKEALEVAFNIDIQSRKQTRGYNAFSDNKIKDFYRALANHYKKNFLIHILYFEENPIAFSIGFIAKSTYFGNQLAFIGEYSRFSPGKFLAVRLIEDLSLAGIIKIDFGSGDNYLKRELTEKYQTLCKVVISKNIFIRKYVKLMYELRHYLYNQLQQNVKVYLTYRKIKNALGM